MTNKIAVENWQPHELMLEDGAAAAVRDLNNSSIIVAGPGAGKTELLAQRASFLLETGSCPFPCRILALSYKKDAAKNLKDRVVQRSGRELAHRVDSHTFDAFTKSVLDRFRNGLPDLYRPSADYQIDTNSKTRDLINQLPPREGLTRADMQRLPIADFQLSYMYGSDVQARSAHEAIFADRLATAFWTYMLHEFSPSVATFWMINRLANLLLLKNAHLRAAFRQTYPFVFIDEFQDTTGLQYDLLQTMFQSRGVNVTAVGDHKQRIMAWAGALDGVFDKFRDDFGASEHYLVSNYRSSQRLVEIQQSIAVALEGQSVVESLSKAEQAEGGDCYVLSFPNDGIEAQHVARLIERWIVEEDVDPRQICVLLRVRVARGTAQLIQALADLKIDARVEDQFQDLLSEPITGLLFDVLRLATQPRVPDAWTRTLDCLDIVRGSTTADSETVLREELSRFLRSMRSDIMACSGGRDEIRHAIQQIVDFVGSSEIRMLYPQYAQGPYFCQQLDLIAEHLSNCWTNDSWIGALDNFEGKSSIPMMTIHKSKGLEYHSVVVLGLEDEELFRYKDDPHEETCAFFVAFSRAKRRVVFTACESRSVGRLNRHTLDIAPLYDILEQAGVVIENIA